MFVAEGVRGLVTAVARKGHRPVRLLPRHEFCWAAPQSRANRSRKRAQHETGAGGRNRPNSRSTPTSRCKTRQFELKQIERLQQRYAQPADKSKGAAAGGFR